MNNLMLHHIGLLVPNLDIGENYLSQFFCWSKKSEKYDDFGIGVSIQFFYDKNDVCVELVAPLTEINPVSQSLSRGTNILNHLAFVSPCFDESVLYLRQYGFVALGQPKDAVAFSGKKVIFFLTPLKMIIEIIEE